MRRLILVCLVVVMPSGHALADSRNLLMEFARQCDLGEFGACNWILRQRHIPAEGRQRVHEHKTEVVNLYNSCIGGSIESCDAALAQFPYLRIEDNVDARQTLTNARAQHVVAARREAARQHRELLEEQERTRLAGERAQSAAKIEPQQRVATDTPAWVAPAVSRSLSDAERRGLEVLAALIGMLVVSVSLLWWHQRTMQSPVLAISPVDTPQPDTSRDVSIPIRTPDIPLTGHFPTDVRRILAS